MGGEWQQRTIGNLAPFAYGKGLPEGQRNPSGNVPVYGSNGIVGYHDLPLTDGPTVVIGRKGTVGAVHYSPVPCWPIDTTFFVTGSDPLLVRYRYYVLKSLGLEDMNADSAVPGLNRDAAHAREVHTPQDEREQRAIAHILGTLDDKIELNRRMSETLEAMARALFKSWFVDFDPVRAKLDGRWRKGQSLPGLPAHLYDLFPARLFNSEFGEIPEGWGVGVVGDLAGVSSGKRPDTRYPEASAFAHVPLWGGNGPMGFVREALIDYPILLTGRVGTLGSVFRITTPCWPSDNTLVIEAKHPQSFEYLFLQLKRIDFASLNRGSTQPLLTQTDLTSQLLLLPRSAVLERFHSFAKNLYSRIDASERESRTLAALRDALLPKLISGQLRVKPEANIAMEKSV